MATYGWIIVLAVILIAAIVLVIRDRGNVKKWLLYAVSTAEMEFGSGTGALKLQAAYDMFIERFPIASKFITFAGFQKMVNEALKAMKEMIDKNEDIKTTLEG